MFRPLIRIVAAVALAFSTTAYGAPVLETLFLQNEVLPGADQLPGFVEPQPFARPPVIGDAVRNNGQGALATSVNGNFLTRVRTDSSEGSANSAAGVYYLFGDTTGGLAPTSLRREATVAGIEQQNFGSPAIDNAGNLTYTTLTGNTGTAGSGFSILWENDTPVLTPGDAITSGPLTGNFFGGAGGVHRTPAGVVSWITSYSDTSGGEPVGSALLRGLGTNEVVLQSGDVIPDLVTIPSIGGAISGNIEWSDLGTNYLTEVALPTDRVNNFGDPIFDGGVVLNGAALRTASGALLRDFEPIPAADGGRPGEVFESFFQWDVNEAGDWILGAFTSDPNEDDVVLVNGEIAYRQGDFLDGVELLGQPEGMAINDRGDIALAWSDTLFINDQKIASPGTMVDTDGDGVGDMPWDSIGLNNLQLTNLPATGGDGLPVLYVSAEVGFNIDTIIRLRPADRSTGDFNGDGVVDAADYTVWRDSEGSELLLAADANGDNVVDADDLAIWTANYGSTVGGSSLAVPEPTAFALLMLGSLSAAVRRR
ncbi:MAG: PEP-CTERM sorting domain-containing protein [Planctomycetota bacterium]